MRFAVIGEAPDSELLTQAFIAAFRVMEVDADVVLLDCEREEFPDCVEHLTKCKFKEIGRASCRERV